MAEEFVCADDSTIPSLARARAHTLPPQVNQLHLELVRRKDATDVEVQKVRSLLRIVEHENADLRFLNTQYAHKASLPPNVALT
jgi:hypothetical protein